MDKGRFPISLQKPELQIRIQATNPNKLKPGGPLAFVLGATSISILNPRIRIFLENHQPPRENGDPVFEKNDG